ncbi:MAG: hypothetical protein NTW28_24305 [Candidatus Solibacter sp.]|nr:hypothetical protein [Candidatus Solibacter sp.]
MASFKVQGPFRVPYESRKGGRTLVFDDFWATGADADADYLADERGCYVFAVRAGGGLKPVYVGQATRTFRQETFNPNNRHKYHNAFSGYAKGTPLMFFVVHPAQKGRTNSKEISEIEVFLIQAGVAMNPSLQNVKGTQSPSWSIKGVIRSGVGKRSSSEAQFGTLFGLHR